MKKISECPAASILLILCWGFCLPSHALRNDYPYLLDENTAFYFEIPSVNQIREDWKKYPFYEIFQREDVEEFIQVLGKALNKSSGLNFDSSPFLNEEEVEDLIKPLFAGQIALGIALPNFFTLLARAIAPNKKPEKKDRLPLDFWVIFDHRTPKLYPALKEKLAEEEMEIIEYEKFDLAENSYVTLAFNRDIVLLTTSEQTARRFIDRYQGDNSQPSLGENDEFQKGYIRLYENSEVFYYLDLSFLSALAKAFTDAFASQYAVMVEQGVLAPAEQLLDGLGLDAFRAMIGSVDMDPEVLKTRNLILIQPNDGFFGRLTSHYGPSLPDTDFLSEDLDQVVLANFRISDLLHDLEKTLLSIFPEAGLDYQIERSQVEQTLGIQFDHSLIDNFSGSFYYVSGETPNTSLDTLVNQDNQEDMAFLTGIFDQGNTFIMGINDRIAFEAMIDSLLYEYDTKGAFQKSEYLGTSLYMLSAPTPIPGPSLIVSDQYLIVEQTNPDFAKLVVSMMQNPGRPIFERQDVRDALSELQPDPIELRYNDLERLLSVLTSRSGKLIGRLRIGLKTQQSLVTEIRGQQTSTRDRTAEEVLDRLQIPLIEDFNYFLISTTYMENDDLYSESIIRPKLD